MEEKKDTLGMLDLVIRPGFCVKENQIIKVNQAAESLFITPGTDVRPLLLTGSEEYAAFTGGCLYLTLNLSSHSCGASVTRVDDIDVFLLEQESDNGELRSMALAARELREPLTNVMITADSLFPLCAAESSPRTAEQVARLNRGLFQILRIIGNMSDAERCAAVSHQETVDIPALFAEFFEKAETLVSHTGITLTYEGPDQPIYGLADREQLERAVLNILSNAIKFTPEEGQVLVSLRRKDTGDVEVMVADTGIGIPDGDLPHIFERFYQVEEHTGLGTRGTGIGLMIVKEFVELHRGHIEVMSRDKQGTTFIVTLPIVNEADYDPAESETEETAEQLPAEPEARPYSGHEFTVLLVEDNEDMRSYLKAELEKNYRVVAVEDAESGLKIVNETMPDLVISDVMLTGMSGVELCRRIKDDFVMNHISVILLTARTAEEHIIEGFDAGADEYIGKPFNLRVLLRRVDNILTQRCRLRDSLRRDTVDIASVERQSPDELFIRKVVALIEENMADPDLNIPFLCDKLAVSHVNFYRKVKAITGLNVNAFIREIRLKKAAQLLRVKGISVTDAMYEVGFNHRSYFSMCFREVFGVTPKVYAKQHNNEHNKE